MNILWDYLDYLPLDLQKDKLVHTSWGAAKFPGALSDGTKT